MDISEKNLEATIEQVLLNGLPKGKKAPPPVEGVYVSGGYRKRSPGDYNRSLCLDTDVVLEFIYATQPREWEKLKAQHGADVKAKFLGRLASEITKRGTLARGPGPVARTRWWASTEPSRRRRSGRMMAVRRIRAERSPNRAAGLRQEHNTLLARMPPDTMCTGLARAADRENSGMRANNGTLLRHRPREAQGHPCANRGRPRAGDAHRRGTRGRGRLSGRVS